MFEWLRRLVETKPKSTVSLAGRTGDQRKVRAALEKGECPDCGGKEFYSGPTGGISENIKCANEKCGSKFNVAYVGGSCIIADRIG